MLAPLRRTIENAISVREKPFEYTKHGSGASRRDVQASCYLQSFSHHRIRFRADSCAEITTALAIDAALVFATTDRMIARGRF